MATVAPAPPPADRLYADCRSAGLYPLGEPETSGRMCAKHRANPAGTGALHSAGEALGGAAKAFETAAAPGAKATSEPSTSAPARTLAALIKDRLFILL